MNETGINHLLALMGRCRLNCLSAGHEESARHLLAAERELRSDFRPGADQGE